jgi:hypothetical protein
VATNGLSGADVTGEVFSFDTTTPTVSSINLVGTSPTNAASVSWTVTFSEPVSGVTNSNFSLVNGGLTSPSLTSTSAVGGAPSSTWTVTASTGTGSGTLGLNKTSNTGVTDVATNNLTGANVTGAAYTIDKTAPTGFDVQTSGNGNNKPDSGDAFVLTFSELVDSTSIKAGWNGSSTAITVNFNNGSSADNATFTGANLGTVSLGATGYVNGAANQYSLSANMVMTTASGRSVVTVTFTSSDAKAQVAGSNKPDMAWIPSPLATDPAGNASSTASTNEAGNDDDF